MAADFDTVEQDKGRLKDKFQTAFNGFYCCSSGSGLSLPNRLSKRMVYFNSPPEERVPIRATAWMARVSWYTSLTDCSALEMPYS